MDCPRCKEKLERINASGIETTRCLYCNGVWVPGESLKQLLRMEPKAPSIGSLLGARSDETQEASDIACPECNDTTLTKIVSFGVELDYCPSCNGVYFDEGELKSVLPTVHKQPFEPGIGTYLASESVFLVIASALFGGKC